MWALEFGHPVKHVYVLLFFKKVQKSRIRVSRWIWVWNCEIFDSKEAKNITPTMKEKNCYDLMVIFMPGGQSNCTTKRHLLRICDCDAQSAIPYVNHPLELNGFLNNHQPIYSDYRKSLFVQQFFLFYYSEVAWILRITFR